MPRMEIHGSAVSFELAAWSRFEPAESQGRDQSALSDGSVLEIIRQFDCLSDVSNMIARIDVPSNAKILIY